MELYFHSSCCEIGEMSRSTVGVTSNLSRLPKRHLERKEAALSQQGAAPQRARCGSRLCRYIIFLPKRRVDVFLRKERRNMWRLLLLPMLSAESRETLIKAAIQGKLYPKNE